MHKSLEDLRTMLYKEVEETVKKGQMTPEIICNLDKLVDILKDMNEMEAMNASYENGYSGYGGYLSYYPMENGRYWGNSYGNGYGNGNGNGNGGRGGNSYNSYNGYRNSNYSNHGMERNQGREEMIGMLEELMNSPMDNESREMARKLMTKLSR